MEKLSEIISKKIITIEEGKMVGYIIKPVFDNCQLVGFISCDDESEIEKFLLYEDIKNINKEGVLISSVYAMQNVDIEGGNSPLGKIVFDQNGVNLGRVEECYLDKKNIKKLQTNLCEIMGKNIACIEQDFVIFQKNNKKIKKNQKKSLKNINFIQKNPKVEILNKIENKNNEPDFQPSYPIKVTANKSKLLGKKIVKDILGFNNEIIAKKDEIINSKIINRAIKHNKLNLLFFNSK